MRLVYRTRTDWNDAASFFQVPETCDLVFFICVEMLSSLVAGASFIVASGASAAGGGAAGSEV